MQSNNVSIIYRLSSAPFEYSYLHPVENNEIINNKNKNVK